MTKLINTITSIDFISMIWGAATFTFALGYFWMLATDINGANAIVMATGLLEIAIATVAIVLAAAVWVKRHVRITIA